MCPTLTPTTDGSLASARSTVTWAAEALLQQTPACTVIFTWRGATLLRQGILPQPQSASVSAADRTKLGTGPIGSRAFTEPAPVYMPALQNLPGRVEFNGWLPEFTQSAVVASLGEHGVVLLGADTPRAFTQEDLQAIYLLCQPVAQALRKTESTTASSDE